MATPNLPPHIEALLSPDAYPQPPTAVELRQTHISYVLFAGEFVYKLKKPLDLGFLDFSTLEKRRHYCEEELRLNRRLCSDTYLDVVPVATSGGATRIESAGDIIDYAVKMRRLPEEGMMTPLLDRGGVSTPMVEELAGRIAAFHASSERNDEIDGYGGLDNAMMNWRENFEQTEPFIGRTITRPQFEDVRAFIESVAESDAALFAQRVSEGRARDCHGDLRADAVCFRDGDVCIFDCIEFNERFRYSDVAADIAFLAMDLEDRGRQDLSDVLMSRYLSRTYDATLPLVLPFYKCYRAYVRGKVDGFQLDQPEIDAAQKAQATASARRSFALAQRYATRATAHTLLVTTGVTGSGKSYLANALAARLGAAVFSSDVVRKQLAGVDPAERRTEPLYEGFYDPKVTERTYAALLDRARPWLEQGKSVVLDASYLMRDQRHGPLLLAGQTNARLLVLECEADESLVYERLSERRGDERVVSDGRWEVYQAQQERREPVDELPVGSHMVVDSARPVSEQVDAVIAHLSAT